VLIYADIIDAQHMARLPVFPRKELDRMRVTTARRYLRRGEYSLFSVTELHPPPDRFGRAEGSREQGWSLQHRIAVRGHFRMVPHGPRNSLRRLHWIDLYYKGPDGGLEKAVLQKLPNRKSFQQ